MWVCQAALRHLQPGGVIINTTSIQAYDPTPQLVDYAATKAALVNFTQNLATEVAERGIRVNSVAPGPVVDAVDPCNDVARQGRGLQVENAARSAAQPAELAGAYVYLACDESRYVTGANLAVTGGKLDRLTATLRRPQRDRSSDTEPDRVPCVRSELRGVCARWGVAVVLRFAGCEPTSRR